jgi:hypothetical protein
MWPWQAAKSRWSFPQVPPQVIQREHPDFLRDLELSRAHPTSAGPVRHKLKNLYH